MKTVGGAGELELLDLVKPYLAEQAGDDDAASWSDERGGWWA